MVTLLTENLAGMQSLSEQLKQIVTSKQDAGCFMLVHTDPRSVSHCQSSGIRIREDLDILVTRLKRVTLKYLKLE